MNCEFCFEGMVDSSVFSCTVIVMTILWHMRVMGILTVWETGMKSRWGKRPEE